MDNEGPLKEVVVDLIKSNLYRVIHADGIWGGAHPSLDVVHLAVFSDRVAIPQQTVYKVTPDGDYGEEIVDKRVSRQGLVVREIEASMMMSISTATALRDWLTAKIKELEGLKRVDAARRTAGEKKS